MHSMRFFRRPRLRPSSFPRGTICLGRRQITLASEWIGPSFDEGSSKAPDVFVFLHGLLGNRRNLGSFAKALCAATGRRGLLLDLRGHGASSQLLPNSSETTKATTLDDCARDVYETLQPYASDWQKNQVAWTLVGHSLGGRVSMLYALQQQQTSSLPLLPHNIWLLDTVPGALDASVRHILHVATQLEQGELPIPKTRSALVQYLVDKERLAVGVAQWLASSFDLQKQAFQFDLEVAHDLVADFDESQFMSWIQAAPVPVDLVRGGANTSWQAAAGHWEELQHWHAADASERAHPFRLHVLPQAGHWVHIDDLPGLVDVITQGQQDIEARTSAAGGRGSSFAASTRPAERGTRFYSTSISASNTTPVTSARRCFSSSSPTSSPTDATESVLNRPPMRIYPKTPKRTVPPSIAHPPYARTGMVPPLQNPDGIYLHDAGSISHMRAAAQLARHALDLACAVAQPGVTTDEVDAIVHDALVAAGAYPSPLNYAGFPKSICSSVNEVICHGIPDTRPLRRGDVVSFDVSCFFNGVHGDNCGTIIVGEDDYDAAACSPAEQDYWEKARHLVDSTRQALEAAIATVKPGSCLTEVGAAIEDVADREGLESVRKYRGHGISHEFHCPPFVKHYRNSDRLMLSEGMIFTIEPMLVMGRQECVEWHDDWTVVTVDKSLAAQFEHTVLVTDSGVEILTVVPES